MKIIKIEKSINIFKEIEENLVNIKEINTICEEGEDLFVYFNLKEDIKIMFNNKTYICNQIIKSFSSTNYIFDIDNHSLICDTLFYELIIKNNNEEGSIYLSLNKENEIDINIDIYC